MVDKNMLSWSEKIDSAVQKANDAIDRCQRELAEVLRKLRELRGVKDE